MLEGYTREEIAYLMERQDANVTSSVSSETDYPVVGKSSSGSKSEAAEDLNVKRMSTDEFRE
ncbi:BRCT domain-containing protein [Halomicrococcus sp. NG-SE-24]|uniref:BRCT domain-containing protein n=1 Tax=Halomicrococcus sp. NG-SE-24 TaxID=3436928 RepID=UPI003D960BCC